MKSTTFIPPLLCLLLLGGYLTPPAASAENCQSANHRVNRAAGNIENQLNSTPGEDLNKRTCLTLQIGILAEWALRQCAADTVLDPRARQELADNANEYTNHNRQLSRTARDLAVGGRSCDLGYVSWTGLHY